MARRITSPEHIPSSVAKVPFAEWLQRVGAKHSDIARELGITTSYVRQLSRGASTPGAKLRLKIATHTKGEVRFDDW